MFEVLVFVYENYDTGQACPEAASLERRLSAAGFESDEISEALTWLQGLTVTAQPSAPEPWLRQPQTTSMRVYTQAEQRQMGPQALGFISFLESAGVLTPHQREVTVDRAMAAPGGVVSLHDLKIIILMVYWSFGQLPDALILDELCDVPGERVAH